jgi:hypothetical protein
MTPFCPAFYVDELLVNGDCWAFLWTGKGIPKASIDK